MSTLSKVFFVASSLLVWSGQASADRGQINFQGELRSSTCAVSNENGNPQVQLPVIDTSELRREGSVAGPILFRLEVENCPPGLSEISVHFEGQNISPEGRLNVAEGGAENVQLQLLNNQQQPMDLAAAKGSQNVQRIDVQDGRANLAFFVRYYSTGNATPGPVSSNVQYSLDYL